MNKIIGNPTTTPYPRPDWNQTDEAKADYIKNKPVVDEYLDANSTNPVQNKAIHKVVTQLVDSKMSHAQFAPYEEQISQNTTQIAGIGSVADNAMSAASIAMQTSNDAFSKATEAKDGLGGCLIGVRRDNETELNFHTNDAPSKYTTSATSQKYVDEAIQSAILDSWEVEI